MKPMRLLRDDTLQVSLYEVYTSALALHLLDSILPLVELEQQEKLGGLIAL